ncbi:hypothetical protein [Croceimicrobium hydrocarbonivorans]|uniref:Uncharacterized protein n=1 Tax=Croceimicrobium hydrocarbonivorans TaxID=2761580 RepID=A0A7H0VG59_9FLAO|nr:hypothetical protein [Croceimicrobium hydrocarbonivorans]QNR24707.1 hypothetical protein H4K34_02360 [Croceimicrobium hydrocarbonivorans]
MGEVSFKRFKILLIPYSVLLLAFYATFTWIAPQLGTSSVYDPLNYILTGIHFILLLLFLRQQWRPEYSVKQKISGSLVLILMGPIGFWIWLAYRGRLA